VFAAMRVSEPNPLTPFPLKEGGTEKRRGVRYRYYGD